MTAGESGSRRIASIDIVRGIVMVLMALDHVRVYAAVPAGGPSPGIFLTRWVTNFVAPAFVFLAGTSAWLYARKHPDLGRFLVTRGLFLVVLELTLLRFAWTFNFNYREYVLAGVIWVIGWSMVLLALLVRLPTKATAVISLVVIAGHNALPWDRILEAMPTSPLAPLWQVLYVGFFTGPIVLPGSGTQVWVLYSIIPWFAVMAAGFAFGPVMAMTQERRLRACLVLGLGAIALFLLLRGTNLYGDPRPWQPSPDGGPLPAIFSFVNTAKYPASLSFLLMTLGPMFLLLALFDRPLGGAGRVLEVYGRVPLFYYVCHIFLIHLVAMLVSVVRLGRVSPWLFSNQPMDPGPAPDGYQWSLGLLYLTWFVVVAMLYPACRWFAGVKARGSSPWLRYF